MSISYRHTDDVLDQACSSKHIPRGPDPIWYAPIKNMDHEALEEVLSSLQGDVMEVIGWANTAQWKWHMRTALGYAIWRGNIEAVKMLIPSLGCGCQAACRRR
jgi:hypothetical protein